MWEGALYTTDDLAVHKVNEKLEEAAWKTELHISNIKCDSINELPVYLILWLSLNLKYYRNIFDIKGWSWKRNKPESIDSSINSSVNVESSDSQSCFVGAWDECNFFLIKSNFVHSNTVNFDWVTKTFIIKSNVEFLLFENFLHGNGED